MIIARSPLRITLGGGGTDLPSYYREHGGFLIAAAIDRHVYVALHRRLEPGLRVRHAEIEEVGDATALRHPILRAVLGELGMTREKLEITSFADLPAGTGLGSSGSFTTALLLALHALRGERPGWRELAEQACHIEMNLLGEPVGKQDPSIAAHGGIAAFDFAPDGTISATKLAIAPEETLRLQAGLVLFYTGMTRSAGSVLREQDQRSRAGDAAMMANLHQVKSIGLASRRALEAGDFDGFAAMMHEHWQRKKQRAGTMTNPRIDGWYDLAMANGALGGKLIGAGNGGFLMFYTRDRARLCRAMIAAGTPEVPFDFTDAGTSLVQR